MLKVIRETNEFRSGGHRLIEVECECGSVFKIQKRRLRTQELCASCAGVNSVNLTNYRDAVKNNFNKIKDALILIDMVEDNSKMPHPHADPQTRLYCLAERAREFKEKYAQ